MAYCDYCREELKEGDRIVCIADPKQKPVKEGYCPNFLFICEHCYLLIDNM